MASKKNNRKKRKRKERRRAAETAAERDLKGDQSMDNSWTRKWEDGSLSEIGDETIEWVRSRPDSVKALMRRFPPSCLVTANRVLRIPAQGLVGIVHSYMEPTKEMPRGGIAVRQTPDATMRAVCDPDWLEVVGYHKGLDKAWIANVLGDEGQR